MNFSENFSTQENKIQNKIQNKSKMSVIVRKATEEDCDFIGKIWYQSLESHLAVGILGSAFPTLSIDEHYKILSLFASGKFEVKSKAGVPSALHWKWCIIAEVDGKPAAAMSCFSDLEGDFEETLFTGTAPVLIELYGEKKGMELHRSWVKVLTGVFYGILNFIKEPEDPRFHTEFIGCLPEFRRRGALRALMKRGFEIGEEKGFKTATLALFEHNIPAKKAYEKAGFVEVFTMRYPQLQDVVSDTGFTLMVAPLDK
uniref:Acetyltransferase (GNAT) family protein n=1 Tax=Iridovirus LCIVAC01 TaxID=2506607 RepID=A0A481YPZ7_9VIRU|nr:MAG: acetyltransferase (GNAT) family protein [Iridovirus LCIVAC01]